MYISFLFVGRISEEKGILLLLSAIETLVKKWSLNFQVDCIGSWPLVESILTHPLYWTYLTYRGRLSKEETIAIMKTATYVVMPSLFLETFWLVALDALACGVPVIAQKKWGLTPFVIDDILEIEEQHSLEEIMHHLADSTAPDSLTALQQKALKTASLYTPKKWLDRFWQLSKYCKKLLLVSDYAVDIGGIENYLFQIKRLLTPHSVSIDLCGKTKNVTWWRRKIDLLVSWLNIGGLFMLWKKLHNESYDLIWLHSIQRRWGRCSLAFLWFIKRSPVWCMYHDFWLIHPFPSRVYEVDQLDAAQSFWGYLYEWKKVLGEKKWWLWWWFFVTAKYIYSLWLFFLLRKVVDIHLVPSSYITPYIQYKLWSSAQVIELPHFVSHAQDV